MVWYGPSLILLLHEKKGVREAEAVARSILLQPQGGHRKDRFAAAPGLGTTIDSLDFSSPRQFSAALSLFFVVAGLAIECHKHLQVQK